MEHCVTSHAELQGACDRCSVISHDYLELRGLPLRAGPLPGDATGAGGARVDREVASSGDYKRFTAAHLYLSLRRQVEPRCHAHLCASSRGGAEQRPLVCIRIVINVYAFERIVVAIAIVIVCERCACGC